MNIIDLHSDIITDIAFRRIRKETRVFERLHLPKLKSGGVIGLICVLWVEPIYQEQHFYRFQQLLHFAIEDFNECSQVELVTSFQDIAKVMNENKIFVLLGLEGLTFMENWPAEKKRR